MSRNRVNPDRGWSYNGPRGPSGKRLCRKCGTEVPLESHAVEELVKMAWDQAAREFPQAPRVLDKRIVVGRDHTDDLAVWLWVILKDAPRYDARGLERIAELLRTKVRQLDRDLGLDPIVYVFFRSKSEQAAIETARP